MVHYLQTVVRITDENIKRNYERFKQEILQGPPIHGLNEAMFMRPDQLHMKLNVVTIKNNSELAQATSQFERVIRQDQNPFGQLKLRFSGVSLDSSRPTTQFNRNKNKVGLLYGRIDSNSLQHIASVIQQHFPAEGKDLEYLGSFGTHIQLIGNINDKCSVVPNFNMRGMCRSFGMKSPRKRTNEDQDDEYPTKSVLIGSFDASSILEKYHDYDFGSQDVTEILLSSRTEEDSDGFPKTIASVKV